ncbi:MULTISPECIES: pyridoxamine 5'-phosphate oxidase family protein [unclassified Streptomyces]|uniref:pyridoxamine 5'-phosphate oxidase family protein n=1 Tax=unclassified Streptomyces TaxID=2593676 RepID=UPI00224EA8D1|nr:MULTISPECIES: pyridoxamine 5'-phosphate oxidase family protein [unclassified Streptomyces]MCX5047699.1 pyridoxamine 5'-phosphate oxidase family protein [Streptomyces sp. NBC_00474]MCX5057613.1 pyridoxamine 5'-phosphate oxidase family protein [Streptomyces sp. NBC_00452]MCX5245511.1 pyridoxamine 5'-phosphate oxidase family protein [Streptomyces sp. NBC_00201]MCX5288688.1 pyridoxamine 5'-phosphate oxidase family protein [Streptomyces sp. NBC_00183]
MADTTPQTRLDPRYSDPRATATDWSEAEARLAEAELFWISTVRPDGRPHVTPLPAVWADGALHFCTGPEERKARNLAADPQVALTTGSNTWDKGYDLVVEGEAVRVVEEERLLRLAAAWEAKYGSVWHFDVRNGAFHHTAGHAFVFAVAPRTVFGFGKGEPFSQTRWRFT